MTDRDCVLYQHWNVTDTMLAFISYTFLSLLLYLPARENTAYVCPLSRLTQYVALFFVGEFGSVRPDKTRHRFLNMMKGLPVVC